jgi:hypothetical protein
MRTRLLAILNSVFLLAAVSAPALASSRCRMSEGGPCDCPHAIDEGERSLPGVESSCCSSLNEVAKYPASLRGSSSLVKLGVFALSAIANRRLDLGQVLSGFLSFSAVTVPPTQVNRPLLR